jgi:hypothetical protein
MSSFAYARPSEDACSASAVKLRTVVPLDGPRIANQKIFTALASVIHTPQASGIPTNAQTPKPRS